MINRYLALEILGPKGIFGKQSSLWMDLEECKVSNLRRKVILRVQAFKKTNFVFLFIEFVIYRNFLEQFYYFLLSDCTLESLKVLYNFFVILPPEVLEQTLINLTAIEVSPPPPPHPP